MENRDSRPPVIPIHVEAVSTLSKLVPDRVSAEDEHRSGSFDEVMLGEMEWPDDVDVVRVST